MFIFIFIPLFTINIHHINLHSTMFIFISSASIAGDTLDIRFTFHYVYIYILSTLSSVTQGVVFTFHYVYIYMFSSLANITQGTIFTFHYVYIYITLQFLRCQGEIHLHSTMFIFILFALNSAINSGMIYIPLCLYLYPSLIISCIFTACNTIYCLPVKSKQLFTFLILVFSLYSSTFIEYSTFVVLPVF